jgi:His/Glu/Gln/Arg/opine family amino acid ABC transporter permease subunit
MYAWLPLIVQGTVMTVVVSCCALLIGLCFGVIFGIGNCNRLKHVAWNWFINFYVVVIRGTPVYVQVLIVYYALPDVTGINLNALEAGVIALGCNSIAYVTEIVRGGINTVPGGQWDAAYVLGYSQIKTLALVILPQTLKNILPALINEVTALLKESSILSAIGLLEVMRVAINISEKTLDPMSVYLGIALIYLGLTTSISLVAKKIEKMLEVGHDYH